MEPSETVQSMGRAGEWEDMLQSVDLSPAPVVVILREFLFKCLCAESDFFFFLVHATSELSVKKKRKRTTGREIEEGTERKKKKNKQYQPNYFISLPITNPKVIFFIMLIWYNQNYFNSCMCL